MNFKRKLVGLAVATFSFPAVQVLAQDDFGFEDESSPTAQKPLDNYIELGAGYTSDDNGKFGEFGRDLDAQGAFGVGGVQLRSKSADGTYSAYVDIDKNPWNTSADLGYRSPGNFGIELYGSNSQKIEMFDALTLYPNTGGSASLPLPAGFVVNTDSGNPDFYGRRTLSVERDTTGITVNKFLGRNWRLSLDFNRQDKDGEKTAAGSAGFGGTAIIVSPVEYQHDQFTIGAEYNYEKMTVAVSYYLSQFDNDNKSVSYEYPNFRYSGLPGAENALAPSNDFERFEINGMLRLGKSTALNWLANWSTAEQDESFLPYSLYPTSSFWKGDSFAAFPTSSLDGKVKRFNGRLTLTSRLGGNFNYKLEYAARDREAHHDPYLWDSVHYDGSVANLGAPSHVYDKNQATWKAEGGYRLPNRSKLRFGWQRDDIDRTRNELAVIGSNLVRVSGDDNTQEDTFWASYRFAPIGDLNLTVKGEHATRDGDVSDERANHLHLTTVIDDGNGNAITVAEGENTLPFFLADRDTDRFSIQADYPLGSKAVLSGGYTLTQEDYSSDRNFDGVINRDSDTVNLELAFSANQYFTISVYGLLQTFESKQNGTQTGGSPTVQDLWVAKAKDETTVFGMNFDWTVIPDKFSLVADMSYSDTNSEMTSSGFDPNTPDSEYLDRLPDYGTEVVRLDLTASWTYNPETTFKLRYLYEDWLNDDFAWKDGMLLEDSNSYGGIAWGWTPPDESTHAVIISVRRAF